MLILSFIQQQLFVIFHKNDLYIIKQIIYYYIFLGSYNTKVVIGR